MGKTIIDFKYKRIERTLSRIGAKIASVNDLTRQAKELANRSQCALICVQREIESLYISLADGNIMEPSKK